MDLLFLAQDMPPRPTCMVLFVPCTTSKQQQCHASFFDLFICFLVQDAEETPKLSPLRLIKAVEKVFLLEENFTPKTELHIACNSLDHDPDLQHSPMFAVSSRLFDSIMFCFYGRKLTFDPFARILICY